MEAINTKLAAMNNAQLLQLLTQLKSMSMSNPQQAKKILEADPALAYAVFQAMIMVNAIDPVVVQQVMAQASSPSSSTASGNKQTPKAHQAQTHQQQQPPPQQQQQQQQQQSQQSQPNADDQRAMIMQIMNMTQEQINSLPQPQRDQVLQLRAQLMAAQQQQQPY